jgi:hypothetical protein
MDPQTESQIKVFQQQNPYYNDLDLIRRQRRTLIGEGRFEIPGRRAGLLARKGLVEIVHGTFGRELDLTSKGRRLLNEGQDDWDRTFMASQGLPVERWASEQEADKLDAEAEAAEEQADADRAKADAARMATDLLPFERNRISSRRRPEEAQKWEIEDWNDWLEDMLYDLDLKGDWTFYHVPARYLALGDAASARKKLWKESHPKGKWTLIAKTEEWRRASHEEKKRWLHRALKRFGARIACGPGGCTCGGSCGCGGAAKPPGPSQGMSYMSVQSLREMGSHSEKLLGMIDENSRLPDWVESKIAQAAQQMRDVTEYLLHGRQASDLNRTRRFSLPGWARDISLKDLRTNRVHYPFSGRSGRPHLETTGAQNTPFEAYQEAKAKVERYQRNHWPGGMGSVIALVEFPDHPNDDDLGGVWVGVVNYYYSPS